MLLVLRAQRLGEVSVPDGLLRRFLLLALVKLEGTLCLVARPHIHMVPRLTIPSEKLYRNCIFIPSGRQIVHDHSTLALARILGLDRHENLLVGGRQQDRLVLLLSPCE